jgi:hypothetical protein
MATATPSKACPAASRALREVPLDKAIKIAKKRCGAHGNKMPVDFEHTSMFHTVLRSVGYKLRPQQW